MLRTGRIARRGSVVAAPDERWGETVQAVVVARRASAADRSIPDGRRARGGRCTNALAAARDGVQVGPEEIIEHCRQTLAGYKCPKRVTFVDSLPKTAIGKISRKNVKELVR